MDEYKSNSRLSKNRDKNEGIKKEKIEKIVKGTVKSKKKNGFLSSFLTGDLVDIRDYVIQDVLIPAVKNTIEDIITNGISMLLNNGETSKVAIEDHQHHQEYHIGPIMREKRVKEIDIEVGIVDIHMMI
jgi:hypothetical protein